MRIGAVRAVGWPCMEPSKIYLQKLNLQAAGLKLHASR